MPRDMGYPHDLKPDISQHAQPNTQLPFNPYTFGAGHAGPSSQPFLYGTQAAPVNFLHTPYARYSLDEGGDASTDRPPPLKRGDACLYCRKRRIRCSATKPSCHHCTKLRRECVYDVGKPVSRVRKLENKVAELESYLHAAQQAIAEANGRAAHAQAQARVAQSQLAAAPSTSLGIQPGQNIVHDMSNGHMSMGGNMPYPTPSSVAPHQAVSAGPGLASTVQPSTAYSYPPGTIEQSTVDITMLDNFQPAPGMRTMAPRVGQTIPVYAPQQPIHVPPVPGPLGQGMATARAQPPQPPQPQQPHQEQQQQQPQQQPKPAGFDWDTLDPTFMSLVNQMGETSTSMPPNQAQHQYGYQQSSQSTQPSNPQDQALHQIPGPQAQPPVPQFSANQIVLHPVGSASSQDIELPVSASDVTGRVSGAFIEDAEDEDDSPSLPAEWTDFDLVGGWYDPNDLPKQARAELLDVFFSNTQTRLSRGYHVPRFMAALDMAPSKRPHPCLLYAMYALVARFSRAPKLKKLDDYFYEIASAQLTTAVKDVDRPFDAARAATILTVYNYSQARYQAATMMLAQASRLAISCGLHQIPSSVFQPSRFPRDHPKFGRLLGVMRSRSWLLGPPQDSIELGERIWAFWNIYIVDRTGAIGAQQPPTIPDYEVRTPYPKPLYEYELGLTSIKDDYSLSSLDDDSYPPQELPHDADGSWAILYIRSLAVLERASKLMYLAVERDSPVYDHFTPASDASSNPSGQLNYDHSSSGAGANRQNSEGSGFPSSVSPSSDIDDYLSYQNYAADNLTAKQMAAGAADKSRMRCARLRTPKAYEKVRLALLRLEADLPPDQRAEWGTWNGTPEAWVYNPTRESVTVHFLRGCAWMFLYDVYSYQAENHEAVAVARRLAHTIKCIYPKHLAADFDVFISIIWFFVSNILIREVKRLQAMGNTAAAADVEVDFNIVVEALKVYGKRHDIANMQVKRAETMRQATLDDMEFMKGDGYDN